MTLLSDGNARGRSAGSLMKAASDFDSFDLGLPRFRRIKIESTPIAAVYAQERYVRRLCPTLSDSFSLRYPPCSNMNLTSAYDPAAIARLSRSNASAEQKADTFQPAWQDNSQEPFLTADGAIQSMSAVWGAWRNTGPQPAVKAVPLVHI